MKSTQLLLALLSQKWRGPHWKIALDLGSCTFVGSFFVWGVLGGHGEAKTIDCTVRSCVISLQY